MAPSIIAAILALLFINGVSFAETEIPRFRTWKASVVALSVSQGLDIASSYGRQGTERNPVFGETFTGRDAAIKLGIVAGCLLVQHQILKRHPRSKFAKMFAAVNFSGAGVTTVAAVRNWRLE